MLTTAKIGDENQPNISMIQSHVKIGIIKNIFKNTPTDVKMA